MTIKEKVINQAIKRITKRLKTLEEIQNATPGLDLVEVIKEARQLLEDNKGIDKRTSKEFIDRIYLLSKRENQAKKMIKQQKNWINDSEEKCKLESELKTLRNELYYIKNK